jgi:hypothetical protein
MTLRFKASPCAYDKHKLVSRVRSMIARVEFSAPPNIVTWKKKVQNPWGILVVYLD